MLPPDVGSARAPLPHPEFQLQQRNPGAVLPVGQAFAVF